MFIAIFDSTHFQFIAMDLDRERALESLRQGLIRHADQYQGAIPGWYEPLEDNANVYEVYPGQCLRDGMVIR